MAKSVAAYHCVQATGYLRAMNMAEQNGTQCSVGEAFFGELSTLETGSFILNTSNGLYLPASACQELTWICVAPSGVACRHSANVADKSESMVQHGNRISAIMVPGVAGWLQEAATKMCVPMNHPATGDPLFTKVDANNPQVAPVQAVIMGAPQQVQVGAGFQIQAPPNVPPGSMLIKEQYKGNQTMILGVVGCLLCGPCGLIVCCLDLDERQVWRAPDGRKFDMFGQPIIE